MSFIGTIPPEAARDAVADMYRRTQDAWGFVPNYAKVFCRRPEVMAKWGQLLSEIRRHQDARRYELVTFAAAHELRNSPCSLAHGQALQAFFSDDQILAIAEGRVEGRGEGVLDELDQAIVGFARQIARDASRVTASHVDTLRKLGCTDAEIFDIAATAAGRSFFTKLLDALGVLPDAPFGAELDVPVRHALTVGRPIDKSASARMPQAESMA